MNLTSLVRNRALSAGRDVPDCDTRNISTHVRTSSRELDFRWSNLPAQSKRTRCRSSMKADAIAEARAQRGGERLCCRALEPDPQVLVERRDFDEGGVRRDDRRTALADVQLGSQRKQGANPGRAVVAGVVVTLGYENEETFAESEHSADATGREDPVPIAGDTHAGRAQPQPSGEGMDT